MDIPLHAFAPAPRIEFDGFVDFGVCVTDNPVSKIIELKNVGMAIGEYEIEYDDDLPIKIEPRKGTLHPLNPPLRLERLKMTLMKNMILRASTVRQAAK